jgi:hypothetical protein
MGRVLKGKSEPFRKPEERKPGDWRLTVTMRLTWWLIPEMFSHALCIPAPLRRYSAGEYFRVLAINWGMARI